MTQPTVNLCAGCSHLQTNRSVTLDGVPWHACEAYPMGIPVEIVNGGDHRELRGDEEVEVHYDEDLPGWEGVWAAAVADGVTG